MQRKVSVIRGRLFGVHVDDGLLILARVPYCPSCSARIMDLASTLSATVWSTTLES